MRFEFFHYDPDNYDKFEWYKTVDMSPSLGALPFSRQPYLGVRTKHRLTKSPPYVGNGTLPCNMRMYPELGNIAIVPDLAGPVAILDSNHEVKTGCRKTRGTFCRRSAS